jgi:hypothetical protein
MAFGSIWQDSHLTIPPLHLLDNVEAAVDDKLIQVPRLLGKARLAIAALLRCAKLVLEERVVLRADNGKVVRHGGLVLGGLTRDGPLQRSTAWEERIEGLHYTCCCIV